eukprot:1368142-Pleurochrysis_carterae.AAC.3
MPEVYSPSVPASLLVDIFSCWMSHSRGAAQLPSRGTVVLQKPACALPSLLHADSTFARVKKVESYDEMLTRIFWRNEIVKESTVSETILMSDICEDSHVAMTGVFFAMSTDHGRPYGIDLTASNTF